MADVHIKPMEYCDKNGQAVIWSWFENEYRVHCRTKELRDELLGWKGASMGSIYYLPGGGREWDVTIPSIRFRDACRKLGI